MTLLEISIPLHLVFSIFGDGVTSMKEGDVTSETIPIQQPADIQLLTAALRKRESISIFFF